MNNPRSRDVGFGSLARSRSCWSFVLVCFLCMFYFLIYFGYPFESFDHKNYIAFLESPVPFLFEPIYTLLAFLSVDLIAPDLRFFVIFLLFTSVPSFLVLLLRDRYKFGVTPQYVYFWILLKSSFIGFISQRFWFAELWMAYFVLRYGSNIWRAGSGVLFSSGIHFGVSGILPAYYFIIKGATKKFLLGLCLIIAFIIYIRASHYIFLGYDYSRYDDVGDDRSFPLFSVATSIFLCAIGAVSLKYNLAKRVIVVSLSCLFFKLIFNNLEVYSRIFQAQIDFVLIICAMNIKKVIYSLLLPAFVIIFIFSQSFFASTSEEVLSYFSSALINSFVNFGNFVH